MSMMRVILQADCVIDGVKYRRVRKHQEPGYTAIPEIYKNQLPSTAVVVTEGQVVPRGKPDIFGLDKYRRRIQNTLESETGFEPNPRRDPGDPIIDAQMKAQEQHERNVAEAQKLKKEDTLEKRRAQTAKAREARARNAELKRKGKGS